MKSTASSSCIFQSHKKMTQCMYLHLFAFTYLYVMSHLQPLTCGSNWTGGARASTNIDSLVELQHYLAAPLVKRSQDPLVFWATH